MSERAKLDVTFSFWDLKKDQNKENREQFIQKCVEVFVNR